MEFYLGVTLCNPAEDSDKLIAKLVRAGYRVSEPNILGDSNTFVALHLKEYEDDEDDEDDDEGYDAEDMEEALDVVDNVLAGFEYYSWVFFPGYVPAFWRQGSAPVEDAPTKSVFDHLQE